MSDLIGKTLGPYRILEQIGAGGMATVYKAYQPSMDRYVAVKILPHYLSTQDEQFLKRFQREARAIARLEHPHILPVHDYGEAGGVTYIAMRYIEAGTLKQHLAKGPLPLNEINRLIGQVGSALDYAHRLGVIHRDVKPGNVLIDNQGNAFLTDFGLARMMETSQELTGSGVGVGTPAYMSPEQGQGVKADHRSDLYSLGVILYEMVTGHVPFEAETPMAVMLKHITDPLPLPRAVRPDVPEAIERVILKALAKAPADRFQTAAEMVQALGVASRKANAAEPERPSAPMAAPAREDVSLMTRVQRIWEQPRGRAGLIGGGLIALAMLGLLLSRIPGNIALLGPGTTVTKTSASVAQAATPTREATPTATSVSARPTATTAAPTPTAELPISLTETPDLLALGESLEICSGDICICKNGDCTPTGLSQTYVNFSPNHLSWSPDGTSFVFTACLLESVLNNPSAACTSKTYIAQRGGSGVFEIPLQPAVDHYANPAWSPDGNWIAAMTACGLSMIRPDGTGYRMVVPYNGLDCPWAIAWSPDSQRLAWIGGMGGATTTSTYVWVANSDGTNARIVFYSRDVELIAPIAWNSSGDSVAVTLQDGKRYLIDAGCQGGATGCDESSRTEILDIPKDWLHNFYPQWISAQAAPAPTPPAASNLPFPVPTVEPSGNALYVNAGAATNGDGSQAKPFNTIQAAIDTAKKGDTIKAAVGVYDENLVIKGKTLILQGGYDPATWQATGAPADTVIDGGARDRVVTILENSQIVMEGFTVTNGRVTCPTPLYYGGGGGFAVVGPNTEVTLQRLIVSHNTVEVCGGGGLEVTEATAVLINALVTGNTASDTAGIDIWFNSRVMLINSTVADNRPDGVGRYDNYEAEGYVLNSIVWGNTGRDLYGKDIEVVNSLVGVNPLFVDRANGDYHLQPGSPAIDAGSATGAPAVDIDGDPRPAGAGVDIGADEYLNESTAQARAFAEPILQAIADREPNFQDDFSTDKGWRVADYDGSGLDRIALADGQLQLIMGRPRDLTHAVNDATDFRNFVLTVDGIVANPGANEVIGVGWRNGMRVVFTPDDHYWEANACTRTDCEAPYGAGNNSAIAHGAALKITVIALDSKFAIFLNGEPLLYVDDPTRSVGSGFSLFAHSSYGVQEAIVAFDNFKIWDISDLP